MTRQNKTLGLVSVFILIVLFFILFRSGFLDSFFIKSPAVDVTTETLPEVSQEMLGDVISSATTNTLEQNQTVTDQGRKVFSLLMKNMLSCLEIKADVPEQLSPEISSIQQLVQADLGPSSGIYDRWMYWHYKTAENKERRLRLEVSENDLGQMIKELHLFNVDKEGQPSVIEIPADKARNPTDDTIKKMLNDGQVFYKEHGATMLFPSGEHIDFIERNDRLSEIEFQRGSALYRCQGFAAVENCQCVK